MIRIKVKDMKKKIVLLPLDERPCNYNFPCRLFAHEDIEIVRPEKLGNKKEPADVYEVAEFLKKECKDAYGLVLSVDMMLYGGLVPSRIHNTGADKLKELAVTVKLLKEENPSLIIYAFQVIMRCPDYSSDDEEPDYYEQYGTMIHMAGEAVHKSRLGISDGAELEYLLRQIDCDKLNDYVARRECNRELNYTMINYVKQGFIDALVIPQDDSAPYGYASMDQEEVRAKIAKEGLSDRILMYPGADEVGLTLVSRMINKLKEKKPKIYVKYASEGSKAVFPIYEGNTLETTVRYQILSAGCQLTDSYEYADIILAITAPADRIVESAEQPCKSKGYCVERNLPELIDFIKLRTREGRIVTIGDNAYGNGGELLFIQLLNQNQLLEQVSGYAGWNTSANTLGTAIAEGVDCFHYGRTNGHMDFLMERYIEDAGYCSVVRKNITKDLSKYGMNYFNIKEQDGVICKRVRKELQQFVEFYLSSVKNNISLDKVWMPWRRMFEVGLRASYKKTGRRDGKEAGIGKKNQAVNRCSNEQVLKQIKGGLIVSCQALNEEPLHSSYIMARMAVAAKEGGAVGIRANTPEDIREIKKYVDLPVIALYKQDYEGSAVYITPTVREVDLLMEENPEIIALDATDRSRPGGLTLDEFFETVRKKYPKQLFMADCATYEEGIHAQEIGFDMVGTTLCGYTRETQGISLPSHNLIKRLAEDLKIPLIAEGGIWEPADLRLIMKEKVHATVIGSAITRPREITRRYVNSISFI